MTPMSEQPRNAICSALGLVFAVVMMAIRWRAWIG